MSRRITVNVGFITNSSSCVYYFPREILDDPQVKAFIEAHELTDGYLGENLWNRGACSSLLVTAEQKAEAKRVLRSYDWDERDVDPEDETAASRSIDPNDDGVYVIYGDEYSDTTHILCSLMSQALTRIKNPDNSCSVLELAGHLTDFN